MITTLSQALRERSLAVTAILCAFLTAALSHLIPHTAPTTPGHYMTYVSVLWHISFFDSVPQTRIYQVFLLSLGFFSFAFSFASKTGDSGRAPGMWTRCLGFRCNHVGRWATWTASLLFVYPVIFATQTMMGAGGIDLVYTIAKSCIAVLLISIGVRYIRPGFLKIGLWVLTAAYGTSILVPGFTKTISLESVYLLNSIDWHFDCVMGSAEEILNGLTAFKEVRPPYGILGPAFIATLEKSFGPMDFMGHIRLVQVFQAAFFVVALITFYKWMPRSPVLMFVGALFIGPWVSTSHPAIVFPNQSGWRFIGLASAVFVLLSARRIEKKKQAILLGLVIGTLFVHAPELSIVAACGYAVYLMTSTGSPFSWRPTGIWLFFLAGMLTAWGAYLAIHRVAFGAMPTDWARLFDTMRYITQSGFVGAPPRFEPAAALILCLAAYRCSTLFLKSVRRGLSNREPELLAIAVMSLVWLAYFVNRPVEWNLWTQLYLLIFLLPRSLFTIPASRSKNYNPGIPASAAKPSLRASRGAAFYALFLFPIILATHKSYFLERPPHMPEQLSTAQISDRPLVSGLVVSEQMSDLLYERLGYVQANEKTSIYCITKLPYTTRLLVGASPRVFVTNPFIHWREENFAQFVNNVFERSPHLIVFDSPNDGVLSSEKLAEEAWQLLCNTLKESLSAKYRKVEVRDGWEIWQKRGRSAQTAK
jgi:hypothetical protein